MSKDINNYPKQVEPLCTYQPHHNQQIVVDTKVFEKLLVKNREEATLIMLYYAFGYGHTPYDNSGQKQFQKTNTYTMYVLQDHWIIPMHDVYPAHV